MISFYSNNWCVDIVDTVKNKHQTRHDQQNDQQSIYRVVINDNENEKLKIKVDVERELEIRMRLLTLIFNKRSKKKLTGIKKTATEPYQPES